MTKIILDQPLRIDQRTHQTQQKLYQALLQSYLAGQAYSDLTVKQLCQNAHIGRATFYRHHRDIADVIVVAYLIELGELGTDLTQLTTATYPAIAGATVTAMLKSPELPRLVTWASIRDRIIPLETGLVQRVLTSLQIDPQQLRFYATFLGTALDQLAVQLADCSPALSHRVAFQRFTALIPNVLPNHPQPY